MAFDMWRNTNLATERLASSILRLPIYPGLSEQHVHQIVEGLNEALLR